MGVSSFFGQRSLSSSVNGSSLRRSDRSSTCAIRASSAPVVSAASTDDIAPLMVRAARGEKIERPPARSEQTDLIVEISLQPWNSFKPDGVILFSDILTPLPACGVPFEIDDNKGPLIDAPFRSMDRLKELTPIDLDQLSFVGESLSLLKQEVQGQAAVLGFVGCPWTLATYVVEGASSALYKNIKSMIYSQPDLLDGILSHIADQIAVYAKYQAASGADCVMMFDSWGGQLPPKIWEQCGGLLERMATSGVDVVGLDWTVDMADARARLGPDLGVQGNVDPAVLFASQDAIEAAVKDCIQSAGPRGHVLNLGHGVLVGTPEENVAFVFDLAKKSTYSS
eukprot:jgi/Picre1/31703/NNA_007054.t1